MGGGRSDGKGRKTDDDAQVAESSRRHASGGVGAPASTDAKAHLAPAAHDFRRRYASVAPGARTLEAWMPKEI